MNGQWRGGRAWRERLTRDDGVPANSNPAQVLYSFDLHGPSSNEESAQLAIVLGPEQDASRGQRQDLLMQQKGGTEDIGLGVES